MFLQTLHRHTDDVCPQRKEEKKKIFQNTITKWDNIFFFAYILNIRH